MERRNMSTCPKCQEPLPVDAPQGLCPTCLARAALDESAGSAFAVPGPTMVLGEAATTSPAIPPAIGQCVMYIGDYELLAEIARGGMGVVFKARQVSLNRVVALKMILSGAFATPADVKRFRTEAENAAALDHPNIVPIYEVGEYAGQPYFSMKLIDGPSLANWLADVPEEKRTTLCQQRQAAQLVALVARAVHHAHQRGVLHRDLKPANVLLDSAGQPHVTDFGLAKRTEGGATASRSGSIVGTPAYMAPEQARGEKGVSVAADVWSLGAMLYEAFTGKVPFPGDTPMDVLLRVIEKDPAPPRALNPAADRDLEIVCLKCLDKEPGRRYGSAAALADDLERWLRGEPITARPAGNIERAVKWVRRRPAIAALMAGLILSTAMGVAGIAWKYVESENHRRDAVRLAGEFREKKNEAEGLAEDFRKKKDEAEDVGAKLAVTARKETEARHDADEARRLALRRLYGTQILLAQNALDKMQVGQARRALHTTEVGTRGWEWHYLNRAIDTSKRTVTPPFGMASELRFARDGKSVAWVSDFSGPCWMDPEKPESGRTIYAESGWARSVGEPIPNVAFTPDLTFAVVYTPAGLALWRTADKNPEPLGTPRKRGEGFEAFMGAVAFSEDGQRLFAAGEKRLACWDRDRRKELWSFPMDTDQAWCVAVSADEKLVAVGFPDDKTVRVFDVGTRKEVFRSNKHLNSPDRAVFTPNGKRLITHCSFRNPHVYDLEAKKQILQTSTYWAASFALSPDGSVGALGMSSGDVVLVDINTGKDLRSLRGHSTFLNTVAFSPDGRLLASGGRDKVVKLWDVKRGTLLRTLVGHTREVTCLAFSPDGKTLISAAGELKYWDLADVSGAYQLQLPYNGEVRCWQFLKDSRRMVIGGWWFGVGLEGTNGLVQVWNTETGKVERTIGPHGDHVTTLSLSADERWLVTGSPDGTVKVWDFADGTEVRSHFKPIPQNRRFITAALVNAVAMRPDGSAYAIALGTGGIMVGDRANGEELWRNVCRTPPAWGEFHGEGKELGMQHKALQYTPNGRYLLALSSYGDRLVTVYEADTGKVVFKSARLGSEAKWALSRDGRYLAFGPGPAGVTIYDLQQTRVSRTIGDLGYVTSLAFSSDGKRLAVGAARDQAWQDPSMKLLDWQEGRTLWTTRNHESVVSDLAFLPDGSRLVSGSFDHTVKLWDPDSGQEMLSLPMGPQPDQRVEHILVSPDGRRITATDGHPDVGAGRRETVMVWSVKP